MKNAWKMVSIHYLCMENHKKEQLYMVMDHWKMLPFFTFIEKDREKCSSSTDLWKIMESDWKIMTALHVYRTIWKNIGSAIRLLKIMENGNSSTI